VGAAYTQQSNHIFYFAGDTSDYKKRRYLERKNEIMPMEAWKIANTQLMLLISTSVTGSIIALSFMDNITKHDSWLVIVSAFVISTPFVLSYVFLAKRFPGKNIIQINDIIYGPYLGKVISLVYIGFFLLIFSLNIRDVANFYVGFIMPDTPMQAFLILFALTCAYAVRQGIEVIARINVFIFIYIVFVLIISSLLLVSKMDFTNFLPVFDIPVKTYIHGTHIMAVVSFCEIVLFLMIMPYSNSYKELGKCTFMGCLIAAVIFIIASVRNTAVLGPSATLLASATYQAARSINIGNFITRIDLFIAVSITLALFIKISLFYYATIAGISQLLNLRSYSTLILTLGGIVIILAITVYPDEVIHYFSARNYHPILVFPIECIIPPLTLLIAKLRGLPRQTGCEIQ
jgi:spore germination protein KB